jgi:hypothetical protein
VAAQVIAERNKRHFSDWADLVNRVTGLSSAQSAVLASSCGLSVDGKILYGAPHSRLRGAITAAGRIQSRPVKGRPGKRGMRGSCRPNQPGSRADQAVAEAVTGSR